MNKLKTKKNIKNSNNNINNKIKYIAVFQPEINNNISGTVIFEEYKKDNIKIYIDLSGLKPGKHGFHIHETGNLLEKCVSCKAHFNPYNTPHGGLNSKPNKRHVGDLGNIIADKNGKVSMILYDNLISLNNHHKCCILGRSLIIHDKEDDLGLTPNSPESLINGLAGERLACSVIGYLDAYYQ